MSEIYQEEQKLTSLSDAIKLAQLKEDIKEMNLSIFEQSIDGVTGFADAIDRVARSWSRIANEDMSGFERMVAIINAIGDTIKGLMGVIETIEGINTLIDTLGKAKEAESGIGIVESGAEIAAIGAVAAAQVAADTTEASSAVAKSATVVAALSAEEAAATGVMAAASTAAYAAIPFAGVGLAAGQIAAMEGLISAAKIASAIPGFKEGGIVDSIFTSGDRNLIRANGGEMIMTTAQQSKLWGAIKTGQFGGGGGEVRFTIEGTKLVGILNQMKSKQSRI
jgi:hypothetical protein